MLAVPIVDIVMPVTPKGAVPDLEAIPERLRTPSVRNPLSPDELIAHMDRYDIIQALVPARRYGPLWGLDYALVRDFVAAHPTRLFATAGVDPTAGMAGVRRLEEAVRDWGFVAAHSYSSWSGVPADDRLYYPYYAKCVELDIPFELECMAAKKTLPSMGRPELVERVANDFPELKLVAMHAGYPWERELVAVAETRRNVWVGCDTLPVRLWPPELIRHIRGEGWFEGTEDRVLFGTNYISMDVAAGLAALDALELPAAIQVKLLAGNARELFRLPAPEPEPA